MKYNTLSYKAENYEPGAIDGGSYIYQIVLDGRDTMYYFDDLALKVSGEKDGIYPIVVCSCELIGCDGMYVTTRIDGDVVLWERFWYGQCVGKPDPDEEFPEFSFRFGKENDNDPMTMRPPLRFELNDYRAIAAELEAERRRKLSGRSDWYENILAAYRNGDTARI